MNRSSKNVFKKLSLNDYNEKMKAENAANVFLNNLEKNDPKNKKRKSLRFLSHQSKSPPNTAFKPNFKFEKVKVKKFSKKTEPQLKENTNNNFKNNSFNEPGIENMLQNFSNMLIKGNSNDKSQIPEISLSTINRSFYKDLKKKKNICQQGN